MPFERAPEPGTIPADSADEPARVRLAAIERLGIPERLRLELLRAIDILRGFGCTEVYLFGSLAHGGVHENSDIDLAIRNYPTGRFFHVLGRLMMELNAPVDLVDLGSKDPFARYLEREEELVQVV